jgi:hypothetical protein
MTAPRGGEPPVPGKRKGLALLAALGLAGLAGNVAAAAISADTSERDDNPNWLMLVMTENTNPARDSEFNDWYDKIDIPDVLRVPGYMRARRGREQGMPESTESNPPKEPIKYVALYDIESQAIDKTIIDMLMASWGMEKAHQSTDLLRVTERVYFHRYGPAYGSSAPRSGAANTYLYMTRFDCCHDAGAAQKFDRWYSGRLVPALLASAGTRSVARYKLYRVLMEKPVQIPEFMTVAEIEADSAERAAQRVDQVLEKLSDAGHEGSPYVEGSHAVFLKINDASRQ